MIDPENIDLRLLEPCRPRDRAFGLLFLAAGFWLPLLADRAPACRASSTEWTRSSSAVSIAVVVIVGLMRVGRTSRRWSNRGVRTRRSRREPDDARPSRPPQHRGLLVGAGALAAAGCRSDEEAARPAPRPGHVREQESRARSQPRAASTAARAASAARARRDRGAPAAAGRGHGRVSPRSGGAAGGGGAAGRGLLPGGCSREIALTGSTTMGLGLLYATLALDAGEEILTTEHDFSRRTTCATPAGAADRRNRTEGPALRRACRRLRG